MMSCGFCQGLTAGNWNEELPGYDDSAYGEELYSRIYGADGTHPYIGVFQNGSNNALFIDINFCPICGRKLVDR